MTPDAVPATVPAPGRPPSPPWVGAIASLALLAGVTWLLTYTLLDLGWQQRLGAWNYLIALMLTSVMSEVLKRWRGHPRN